MIENLKIIEDRILNDFNIDYRRYLFKKIDFNSKLIALVGSRGVGKTTMLLQYLKDLKKNFKDYESLYFSYDYPANVNLNLFETAEEFYKKGGKFLLVDEVHKYKNFALDLKAIYDFLPGLSVVFTGSSASSIYNAQADLSRRALLYHLKGLSFREFLELKLNKKFKSYKLDYLFKNSDTISKELIKEFKPLEHFKEYLQYGYYPFYFNDKKNYLEFLNAVVNLTIDVDLVMLNLIKSSFAKKLKKLLTIICYSKPFELNITKLAQTIEVSRNTVYAYLEHLSKADLINVVEDYKKGISSLAKPSKVYLNNTNLHYILCNDFETGTLREAFFVSQLINLYNINTVKKGDFIVDNRYTVEIGEKNKGFMQIKDIKDSFIIQDTDVTYSKEKIPLWMFGFLY